MRVTKPVCDTPKSLLGGDTSNREMCPPVPQRLRNVGYRFGPYSSPTVERSGRQQRNQRVSRWGKTVGGHLDALNSNSLMTPLDPGESRELRPHHDAPVRISDPCRRSERKDKKAQKECVLPSTLLDLIAIDHARLGFFVGEFDDQRVVSDELLGHRRVGRQSRQVNTTQAQVPSQGEQSALSVDGHVERAALRAEPLAAPV